MPVTSRRTFLTIAGAFLAAHPVIARASAPPNDLELGALLRDGGLVILLRHGATFTHQADTDPFNFDNISAQRQLNEAGKALARSFGESLRQAGCAVGKAYTSKFNRAYQTAVLAGFADIEKTTDLTEGGLVVSPDENARRAGALRKLVAASPEPGTNTVLVTHKPNIVDAFGKDWFDVREGEGTIFRPADGTFILVARLQMADWTRIGTAMDR